MNFNNSPAINFLFSLDNRDYPKSAKRVCNPNYDFSRLICTLEKNNVSFSEEESEDKRTPYEVIDKLYELKNKCRKPVIISKPFFTVMEKSEDAFTPFHDAILKECDGEFGVVRAPYLVKDSFLLYAIENGNLSIWVVLNHKQEDVFLFTPSAYLSVSPLDNTKGIGHKLVIDYIPLLEGCFELPEGLYTHAFTILTYLCLRKWAEVEIAEVPTKVRKDVKKKKKIVSVIEEGLSYFTFDSKWYTEICNNSEFKVSGHFRLQPYSDGSKRLIYI